MKRCLCCGKPLRTEEGGHGWHQACIKSFFGTREFPDIDISNEVLNQLAMDNTYKGYTVPGVQKKLSLHLSQEEEKPRLTLVNYPTGYILKPQTEEYRALPEMEYLTMQMAEASRIKTVPYGLVRIASQQNAYAYITRRIDRTDGQMLAMEDFCQLAGRLTEDKYRGSYERCGKLIEQYAVNPGLDLTELFLRVVFSFVVGNSDMHLKNLSLIETAEGSRQYSLSEAYDMLSTNVILPADPDQLALTVNGKKQQIRRKDFLVFAEAIGIHKSSAEKMIGTIVKRREQYIRLCRDSYLPEEMQTRLIQLIETRSASLA